VPDLEDDAADVAVFEQAAPGRGQQLTDEAAAPKRAQFEQLPGPGYFDVNPRDSEARRFAAATKHELALRTLAFTGLRVGELRGLVWGDIDLAGATLRLRYQADKCGRRVEPKTPNAKRTVPLPAVLVTALREHRLATGRPADDAPVFRDAATRPSPTGCSRAPSVWP